MKLSDFDYHLPKNLIAQKPIFPRDHSRLLVLKRKAGKIFHHRFFEIGKILKKGDVLVLSNTKVFPARLFGKKSTGGKVEILLLKEKEKRIWECLVKTRKPKIGAKILFSHRRVRAKVKEKELLGELLKKKENGIFEIKFNKNGKEFWEVINKIGWASLPLYIKETRILNLESRKFYQTCFAKHRGSVAAPTAGFHFTPRLLAELRKKECRLNLLLCISVWELFCR